MGNPNKGVKRHEALYPLSHHHHHGLVLALRLNRLGTEKQSLSLTEAKKEVQEFWDTGGQTHFRDEEEIVLPTYAQYASLDDPLFAEMLLEHVQIRALINQMGSMEDEQTLTPTLRKLGKQLEAHIRKEERLIFPMIEKALPERVLIEMEPHLHTVTDPS